MIPNKNVKKKKSGKTKNTETDKYLYKYNNVDCVKQRMPYKVENMSRIKIHNNTNAKNGRYKRLKCSKHCRGKDLRQKY